MEFVLVLFFFHFFRFGKGFCLFLDFMSVFFFILSSLCFWQACALLLQEALAQLELKKDEMKKMAEQLRLADRFTPPLLFHIPTT
jgi:hypothetical protein